MNPLRKNRKRLIANFSRKSRNLPTPFLIKDTNYPKTFQSECLNEVGLSADEVMVFTLKSDVSQPPRDANTEINWIYENIIRLSEDKDTDTEKLSRELLPQLEKINTYPEIVPLLPKLPDINPDVKIITAPFLVCVNVLLRSGEYAFLPFREPTLLAQLLKRTLYTMDKKFISWVKKYEQLSRNI